MRTLKHHRRHRASAERPTRARERRVRQAGFTMIELAIVVLILGLILGGLAMPLATQRENARLRDARQQIDDVQAALEGFVLANGFLPCPATPGSNGTAAAGAGICTAQHGFVPATTLNVSGSRNDDNLLLDPWGSPLRYSVTDADADGDGQWDFTTAGEIRDVTMPLLQPDLAVCSSAAGASATACGSAATTLSSAAPAVVFSLGKDWPSFSSPDQAENVGSSVGGGPSGASYPIAANAVFVSRGKSNQPGGEFDDVVRWLSANTLFHGMVAAGQLP